MYRNIIRALLIGGQSISHVIRGRTCVSAGVDSPAGGHVTRPAGVPADVDRPAHGAQQLEKDRLHRRLGRLGGKSEQASSSV